MNVKIIRSGRRKKTISGRIVDGVLEIRAPADMAEEELRPHVDKLRKRLDRKKTKKELDDGALEARAKLLNKRYFSGKLAWESVRWVTNQNGRFGSCTPANRTIRLSHRLAAMPQFVQDYVLVHELAHLLEANHGPRFWKLVNRFPKTERARGYLMAVGLEDLDE